MKNLFIVLGIASTLSAYATEFSAKMDDVNCTIKNNIVTRTQTFGKDASASITEMKEVKFSADSLIMKAMEASTQVPAGTDDEFAFSMVHEGKSYSLNTSDSKETMALIRMITKSCR